MSAPVFKVIYLISIRIQGHSHSIFLPQCWKSLIHCQKFITLHMKQLKWPIFMQMNIQWHMLEAPLMTPSFDPWQVYHFTVTSCNKPHPSPVIISASFHELLQTALFSLQHVSPASLHGKTYIHAICYNMFFFIIKMVNILITRFCKQHLYHSSIFYYTS